MDKLKQVLDFFKKYLFWFIFAVTTVLVLVCWWMSTASLATSFQKQKVTIEKKFAEVKAVADDQQHPTQEYIKAIKNEDENGKLKECILKGLNEGVLLVWQTLYDEQKKNNRWPDLLGREFLDQVAAQSPSERIPDQLRERYKYVISNYFPILYKIIDLRHPGETAETGGGAGNAAPPPRQGYRMPTIGGYGRRPADNTTADNPDWIGTVDWDQSDRERLEERFSWKTTPESDVIRLRQEDLWVYKTLLEVIRDTNNEGDSKSPVIVPNVKRIEWIQIGADAIGAWSAADQTVFKATEAAAAAADPRARPSPAARDAPVAAQDSKEQLMKDRYIDDKGVPLDAEAKPPYSEFKMMPISMKLYMDQKKISKLLVACVNSPMPIEVRRVRIRPGTGELLEPGAAAAAPNPAAGTTSYRRLDTRGPARQAVSAGGGEQTEPGSYNIPVEIQGIIYIYNEPDQKTLGTGAAAEKPAEAPAAAAPAAEAGAPGTAPGTAPATPAETAPATPPATAKP